MLWDFGAKENIRRELAKRGCEVIVIPARTSADDIIKLKPDGIMLSNGPGDPADNVEIIEQMARLCTSGIPIFGICWVISCWLYHREHKPLNLNTDIVAPTSLLNTLKPAVYI